MPLISVILPTYNRANLISRSIKSVLNQTFDDFELIIVDDGSSDNTEYVASTFIDNRIKFFKLAKNQGQNPALNFGVSKTSGKYIAFIDSDDEWLPDFLYKSVNLFKDDESLGAVYASAYGQDLDGKLYSGYNFSLKGNIYKEVLEQGYLSYMITIVVKKEIIDLLKPLPFDPEFTYAQDDDFCFQVSKIAKVGLIEEPLAIIHSDSGDQLSKNSLARAYGREKLFKKYRNEISNICGRKILFDYFSKLGYLFYLANDKIKARYYFIEAIKIYPLSKALIYTILLTKFGFVILKIRNKLVN
jgi:glycosyltransferase involved in cell wall biosynthesis